MKTTTTILAALGLAASGSAAFAAAHAMDPAAVTCAEFIDMDDEGKMGLAEATMEQLETPAEADALMIQIDTACSESGAEDTTVLNAATAG